jgi:ATP-dependent Lon protease
VSMHDLTAPLSYVVCQGAQRMRVLDFIPGTPFLTAAALEISEPARSSSETKATFDERQCRAVLHEQMPTIQRELGEGDGKGQEVAELAEAIAKANMPEEAECQALKERRRYERMPEGAAETRKNLRYRSDQQRLPLLSSRRAVEIGE